jgi:hypothetical protein
MLTAVGVSALAGCAPLSPARYGQRAPSTEIATLSLVRIDQPLGAGLVHTITLDGMPVARLAPGERTRLAIAPGSRVVGIVCSSPQPLGEPEQISIDAAPGASYEAVSSAFAHDLCDLAWAAADY